MARSGTGPSPSHHSLEILSYVLAWLVLGGLVPGPGTVLCGRRWEQQQVVARPSPPPPVMQECCSSTLPLLH